MIARGRAGRSWPDADAPGENAVDLFSGRDGRLDAGTHDLDTGAGRLAPGTYEIRVRAGR